MEAKSSSQIEDLFVQMQRTLDADRSRLPGLDVTYQFNIEGEGGGVWHLTIRDGRATVLRGPAERPDHTTTISASDYVSMATGEVSGSDLFFSGRLRSEGSPIYGMLLGKLFR